MFKPIVGIMLLCNVGYTEGSQMQKYMIFEYPNTLKYINFDSQQVENVDFDFGILSELREITHANWLSNGMLLVSDYGLNISLFNITNGAITTLPIKGDCAITIAESSTILFILNEKGKRSLVTYDIDTNNLQVLSSIEGSSNIACPIKLNEDEYVYVSKYQDEFEVDIDVFNKRTLKSEPLKKNTYLPRLFVKGLGLIVFNGKRHYLLNEELKSTKLKWIKYGERPIFYDEKKNIVFLRQYKDSVLTGSSGAIWIYDLNTNKKHKLMENLYPIQILEDRLNEVKVDGN